MVVRHGNGCSNYSRSTGRSRVTNGSELFAANEPIDGRSMASRRFRDILGKLIADLGGSDRLSGAQPQLLVALMRWECEQLEARSIACTEELLKLGIDTGRPPLASTWRSKAISLGRLYLP